MPEVLFKFLDHLRPKDDIMWEISVNPWRQSHSPERLKSTDEMSAENWIS